MVARTDLGLGSSRPARHPVSYRSWEAVAVLRRGTAREAWVVTVNGEHNTELDEDALRDLVQQATRSAPDAWEQLYRRSYPRLFAYARRRLGSDSAADDAVSETMLRALDRIDSFTWQGAGFDAWLYGILRNVVLETHRHDGRARPAADLPEPTWGHVVQPADALLERDQQAEIRAAFALLSPDDQEVLELRVVAGLAAEGVAQATGRTAGAVRMAQSRALDRLRTHYEGVTHD